MEHAPIDSDDFESIGKFDSFDSFDPYKYIETNFPPEVDRINQRREVRGRITFLPRIVL